MSEKFDEKYEDLNKLRFGNRCPVLRNSFTPPQYTDFVRRFYSVANSFLGYHILIGDETEPLDPRVDEAGNNVEFTYKQYQEYKSELQNFRMRSGKVWDLIQQATEQEMSSLIQNVELFDSVAAWKKIQEHFGQTKTSVNYADAKEAYEKVSVTFGDTDDHLAKLDKFLQELWTAAETIRNVHGKQLDDIDLIIKLGQNLPDDELVDYHIYYSQVMKIEGEEITWQSASTAIRTDIKQKFQRIQSKLLARAELRDRYRESITPHISNFAGNGKRKNVAFFTVGDKNYSGCNFCDAKDHLKRDCEKFRAWLISKGLTYQQYKQQNHQHNNKYQKYSQQQQLQQQQSSSQQQEQQQQQLPYCIESAVEYEQFKKFQLLGRIAAEKEEYERLAGGGSQRDTEDRQAAGGGRGFGGRGGFPAGRAPNLGRGSGAAWHYGGGGRGGGHALHTSDSSSSSGGGNRVFNPHIAPLEPERGVMRFW